MTDEKRPYRMKKRTELQQATRLRITESAVELHGTLGPARTSMSAVAEHAGVRRSTLYRYFADEAQLFEACSKHWSKQHPVPDIDTWATIRDPQERLKTGLLELYEFYAGAERMLTNIFRDLDAMEVVKEQFAPFALYMNALQQTLLAGHVKRGRRAARVRAAVGHAIAFTTWHSLVREQRLTPAEAVEMMCKLTFA